MLLEGVFVPLTTPFYPDGRLYLRKLEYNLRRLSLTPVSGLILLGSAAEAASLSDGEQRQVLTAAAETAAKEKVLIAAIGQAGVAPSVDLARYAASLHFDAVLLTVPRNLCAPMWHDALPSIEVLTWFRSLADRSPLPVILSSEIAGRPLPITALLELGAHPNVLGVLEQSTHISRVTDLHAAAAHISRMVSTTTTFTAATMRMLQPAPEPLPGSSGAFVSAASLAGAGGVAVLAEAPAVPVLKTRTKQVGLQILWAHAADATRALSAGATGIAAPVSAAVPQAVFEIWAAWKDGDHQLMIEKERRLFEVEPFFSSYGVAALKYGAELSGYFGGRPRLPLIGLTADQQRELAGLLYGIRS